MNQDNTIKITLQFFAIILIGAFGSAIVGGGFGALVALISPEFVKTTFLIRTNVTNTAVAAGMICGLFIGAGASCFACFLAMIIKVLKLRFEKNV